MQCPLASDLQLELESCSLLTHMTIHILKVNVIETGSVACKGSLADSVGLSGVMITWQHFSYVSVFRVIFGKSTIWP